MENILELIVSLKIPLIIASVVLILALIGALADRSEAKRFILNDKKTRSNVDKASVDEDNKTAGEAPTVTNVNSNIAQGTEFTAAPVNATVQEQKSAVSEEVKTKPATTGAEVGNTQTI